METSGPDNLPLVLQTWFVLEAGGKAGIEPWVWAPWTVLFPGCGRPWLSVSCLLSALPT